MKAFCPCKNKAESPSSQFKGEEQYYFLLPLTVHSDKAEHFPMQTWELMVGRKIDPFLIVRRVGIEMRWKFS